MANSLRGRIALALLVLFTVSSSTYQLWSSYRLDTKTFRSNVAIEEYLTLRFKKLEAHLPPGTTLGYIEDTPNDEHIGSKHYLAQYALVPWVLVPGTDRPLILGNFSDPHWVSRYALDNLELIEDFGDGVCLFRFQDGR